MMHNCPPATFPESPMPPSFLDFLSGGLLQFGWWGMLAYGAVALAVVAALWCHGLRRRPAPPDDSPRPAWASRWLLARGSTRRR